MDMQNGKLMADTIKELAECCVALMHDEESASIRHTEEDVLNALTVFNYFVSNYAVHRIMDAEYDRETVLLEMDKRSAAMRSWMMEFTGIDPKAARQTANY